MDTQASGWADNGMCGTMPNQGSWGGLGLSWIPFELLFSCGLALAASFCCVAEDPGRLWGCPRWVPRG
eukprot:12716447-Alexandrium_andersonii.AAC.1